MRRLISGITFILLIVSSSAFAGSINQNNQPYKHGSNVAADLFIDALRLTGAIAQISVMIPLVPFVLAEDAEKKIHASVNAMWHGTNTPPPITDESVATDSFPTTTNDSLVTSQPSFEKGGK